MRRKWKFSAFDTEVRSAQFRLIERFSAAYTFNQMFPRVVSLPTRAIYMKSMNRLGQCSASNIAASVNSLRCEKAMTPKHGSLAS